MSADWSPATVPPTAGRTLVYRVFLGIALVVDAVAVAFFAIGIADGSVSSFNIGIWIVLLAGLGAVLAAALVLRSRGRTGLASAVLSVVAVPGMLGGLAMLVLIVAPPRWN